MTWASSRRKVFRHGGQKSSLWGGNSDRGQATEGEQGEFSKKTEGIWSLRQERDLYVQKPKQS